METIVNTEDLYILIKRAVREVLHEEMEIFWQRAIPDVSQAEMSDIIEQYGAPSASKEVAYSEVISL